MTECAPVVGAKTKEKRAKVARRRVDQKKSSSLDEEIVDGFAMASFVSLRRDEIQNGGVTADNVSMSKRNDEPVVIPQKRKSSPNKDKSKAKHRRSNMAEANSSDESLGGSSGVRSKRPKKKSKECDSESEGDVKGCESEQSDHMAPHRMLRPGPGNLNDLFKVAAKERSNLKKQSSSSESNQSRGGALNVNSPTTIGAPSRAPYQPGANPNPTDSPEAKKPVESPRGHGHFPVPEHMPLEMAAYMMSHRGPFPLGMPTVSSGYGLLTEQQQRAQHQTQQTLVQAQIQHQHQHHHEHQHHHQHQHQFSMHGPHHLADPGQMYGGPVLPPAGSSLQQLGLPYGIPGGLPMGSSMPIGAGPSAFQSKKHGKWCSAHGQIAWFIHHHRKQQKILQAHVETQKELQAKVEAAAALTSNLGVYDQTTGFHPKVPVPGIGLMSVHGMAETGVRPVIPNAVPDDGHTTSHDATHGFPLHPLMQPMGIGRPLENDASGTPMVYSSYPGLGMEKDGRALHPLYSMVPWSLTKKEISKGDEFRNSKEHAKEGKKKSRDERNSESDRPQSGLDAPAASQHGLDHVKGSSSAFSSVGGRPSIGSGLGIGAFVNHGNASSAAAHHSSSKVISFPVGVTSTMLNSMKPDPKCKSNDKPSNKTRESPKLLSTRRPNASSPSSPKRPHQHSSPVVSSLMSRRLGFGCSPMQSFSPAPPGHIFGGPGAFMGFPAMGPGGIMMPTFGSHTGMLNMHPAAAAYMGQQRLMGFEERSGVSATKT